MSTADEWMRSHRGRDRIQHDTTHTPPATTPAHGRAIAVEWSDPLSDNPAHKATELHLRTCSSCATLNSAGRP